MGVPQGRWSGAGDVVHFNPRDLGADLLTILILVVLEGLLSGDNALVLAVIVLPLPEEQQRKALRYGLFGAFVLRVIATLLAVSLAKLKWVGLLGGLYLLYLPLKHFTQHPDEVQSDEAKAAAAAGILGLSLFWTIVIKADLVDLVFAVDSILAAVALTRKAWVLIAGGILGILMMRLLTLQVLSLVKRYPKLIDGAYVVICWVGIKLIWEYLHGIGIVPWQLPPRVSIGIVLALFVGCFLYARAHAANGPGVSEACAEAEKLLTPNGPRKSLPEPALTDEG
jgi:YkoY family integral membrane protein